MLASILTLAVTDLLTLIQYQSSISILQNMLYMMYKLLQRYTQYVLCEGCNVLCEDCFMTEKKQTLILVSRL